MRPDPYLDRPWHPDKTLDRDPEQPPALTAPDAEKLGLITRAVPDDKLEAEAAALVQRFQEGSAPVLQHTRRAIAGGLDLAYADAVRHAEDVYLNQLINTEDVEEGLRAVTEKRKPHWKDR